MYAHHKFDHVFDPPTPTALSYAVCATPRSGSSLLCEHLCACGLGGAPTEFFDRDTYHAFRAAWGITSIEHYLAELLRRKTGPNGVFGLKLHWEQYLDFFRARDVRGVFPNLRAVTITRRDRLGQAISFARAAQTGLWAAHHTPTAPAAVFDRAQIAHFLQKIEDEERAWEEHLQAHGIVPVRVVYEDLVLRPQPVLLGVLRALGIAAPDELVLPPPTLRRQADALSEEWRRLYNRTAQESPRS